MKNLVFTIAVLVAAFISQTSLAQSTEHQIAEQVCNCSQTLIESQLSPALKNIIISKLTADSEEEFQKNLVLYIQNNASQAAKEFEVIKSMTDPNSPYSRCLLKTQMAFPNVNINSPEMQQFVMVELYEMQCEFSAALLSFEQSVKL